MKNWKNASQKNYLLLLVLILVVIGVILNQQLIKTGNAVENPSNIKIEIPKEYNKILPGETLWFTTRILNLANSQRVDIILNYEILNSEKNSINSRTETVAIETQASFVGKIEIPENTAPGDYTLKVTMTQASGEVSSVETSFTIKDEKDFQSFFMKNKKIIIIALSVIIALILLLSLKSRIKNLSEKMAIKSQISSIIKKRS